MMKQISKDILLTEQKRYVFVVVWLESFFSVSLCLSSLVDFEVFYRIFGKKRIRDVSWTCICLPYNQ